MRFSRHVPSRTLPNINLRSVLRLSAVLVALAVVVARPVAGQEAIRSATELIGEAYTAEIGRTLPLPSVTESVRLAPAEATCEATCDAFTPRLPFMMLEWDNEAAGTGPVPAVEGPDAAVRIDVSSTAGGFAAGNYSTVRLSHIPAFEATVLDPASPTPLAATEVLLNPVRSNNVVERAPELPVFLSHNVMVKSLPQLEPAGRVAVEADIKTGSLGQVRVLGRSVTPIRGEPRQVVTMVGFEPGGTYRLRVVSEQGAEAETLTQQICRIPVCPADFVGPDQ